MVILPIRKLIKCATEKCDFAISLTNRLDAFNNENLTKVLDHIEKGHTVLFIDVDNLIKSTNM